MKYCVDFNKKTKCLTEVDEIKINYSSQKLETIQYMKEHYEKTFILSIDDDEIIKEIERLSKLKNEDDNLKFKVEFNYKNFSIVEENKNKIKFDYFYNLFAKDWDTFIGLVNCGVSDIYIVENLGFELDKISIIAHDNNINIRCFANIAQSSWKGTNDLKKFFIRPEDVNLYNKYIDVIHFMGKPENMDLYYKIYNKDKKWYGNLNELIIDFNIDFDTKYTIPRFAEKRIRCGKECLKNGKCKICETVLELSKTLEKANLVVKLDKEGGEVEWQEDQ